jgi:MFS family permease
MIIPLAVGQAVAANLSGRLLASRGARLPHTLGGALLAIGGFLLVPLTAHTESVYLLATYAIFGLGAGMVTPPITNTAISGLPPDQVGLAGALAASARQFGISIGVAVTGSIVASTGAGFIDSSHAAWAVLGGCGIVALALGVISTSSWAKAAAARNSQRLATHRSPNLRATLCPADPQTPRGKSNAVPLTTIDPKSAWSRKSPPPSRIPAVLVNGTNYGTPADRQGGQHAAAIRAAAEAGVSHTAGIAARRPRGTPRASRSRARPASGR